MHRCMLEMLIVAVVKMQTSAITCRDRSYGHTPARKQNVQGQRRRARTHVRATKALASLRRHDLQLDVVAHSTLGVAGVAKEHGQGNGYCHGRDDGRTLAHKSDSEHAHARVRDRVRAGRNGNRRRRRCRGLRLRHSHNHERV